MRLPFLRRDPQPVDSSHIVLGSSDQDTVVELVGHTKAARAALGDKPLIIRCFPFRIGRISRTDPSSTAKLDLLLADQQPYHVSRLHLTIDRIDGTIVLIDSASRCGTCVDTTRFGSKIDAESRVVLAGGRHTLALGLADSPYLFQLEVRALKASDHLSLDGMLPDRLPQARMLYDKLCSVEQNLLNDRSLSPLQRSTTAGSMAKAIIERADLLDLLQCLASSPLSRGDHLAQHSVNVAVQAVTLFGKLGHSPDDMVKLTAGALLHDIGMQGVDRNILLKTGKLSSAEFDAVKRHTSLGGELLSGTDDICTLAALLARDHHERIDRSGYPRGVDVLADHTRFLGLLDSFEAMTHDRPQRQAFTPHEAVRKLAASTDSTFDPETRKAFLNVFSFFPVFSMVRLSTGETGQVVSANQGRPLAPQVRVLLDRTGRPMHEQRIVDLSCTPGISIVKDVVDRDLSRQYSEAMAPLA